MRGYIGGTCVPRSCAKDLAGVLCVGEVLGVSLLLKEVERVVLIAGCRKVRALTRRDERKYRHTRIRLASVVLRENNLIDRAENNNIFFRQVNGGTCASLRSSFGIRFATDWRQLQDALLDLSWHSRHEAFMRSLHLRRLHRWVHVFLNTRKHTNTEQNIFCVRAARGYSGL